MIQLEIKPEVQKPNFYVLEESRSLADGMQPRPGLRHPLWRPRTDVFETEEAVVVRVEVAGMREVDFSIVLDSRFLSVRGVRSDTTERRAYHQMEIPFGEFISEVELSVPVMVNAVEAVYSNGFLCITLPKAQPHKIDIDA